MNSQSKPTELASVLYTALGLAPKDKGPHLTMN
jgi:hypothetical protein